MEVTESVDSGMLRLLVRRTEFRRLWLGNLISVCGGWFSAVAVFAMVYHHAGAGLAAGATLAVRYLPGILLGGLAGVLADRLDRRTVMIGTDLALAVVATAFLLADDARWIWLVYPLTFLSAGLGYTFQAARDAWMPSLVEPGEYVLFSALVQVNGLLFQAVGGLAGAAAVGLLGWRWAFLINAVSYLLSAWCTWRVRGGQRRGGPVGFRDGPVRAFLAGLRYAWRRRQVRALLAIEALFCVGLGAAIVAMIDVALRSYHLGDGGVGWFYAVQGLVGGTVLLWAAPRIQRLPIRLQLVVLGGSCLAEGMVIVAFGLAPGLAVALICWAGASAADVVYGPVAMATLLRNATNEMRGRLISLWTTAATAGLASSSLAAGVLLSRYPPAPVLLGAGSLMATAGLTWLLLLRTGRV
ncbi:MAG: MFS transporter [Pseudonocardiales bacterium]